MRRFITLLAVLLLTATVSLAGTNRWTSAGPGVGYVFKLAADPSQPNRLFAMTGAGMYRTSDGGLNWNRASHGLPNTSSMPTFTIAPGNPLMLYAAVGQSIWASADLGDHWLRQADLGNVYVGDLRYDTAGKTLYAVTNDGVYLSRDGGATWANETADLGSVGTLAISATAVYAAVLGTDGRTDLLRSRDGFRTWERLTNFPGYTLFASQDNGALFGLAGQAAFVSNDEAKSWAKLAAIPANRIYSIEAVGTATYAATDGGVLWYDQVHSAWTLATTAIDARNLQIVSTGPPEMFVTPQAGVSKLANGDWTPMNHGLPGMLVTDVGISGGAPSIAYATTGAAAFLTEDGGQNWDLLPSLRGSAVAVSPDTPDTAYVATGTALMKTADRGLTWTRLNVAPAGMLAIAPSDAGTLYAEVVQGMVRSFDGGVSWNAIDSGIPLDALDWYYGFESTAMAVSPSNAANAAVALGDGVFTTLDGGASWQQASNESWASALAIDSSGVIYAARSAGGIIFSGDGGATWRSSGLVDKYIQALVTSGSRLFAGTDDGHVYSSDDGGANWRGLDDGLPDGRIAGIVVDESGESLYTATAAGVYAMHLVGQILRPERFEGDSKETVAALLKGGAFVLPVVGNASGGDGTSYNTEVALTNERDAQQAVVVVWLPQGSSASPALFRLTLPAGDVKVWDINQTFGIDGIGSLAFFPVDESGAADAGALIDGSARIWSHPTDGRAPLPQAVEAARSTLLDPHPQLVIAAATQNAQTRLNVGIVNLSTEPHQFTIQFDGPSPAQLTFAVPALSMVQLPAPEGDFQSITGIADDASTRWLFYGSAIDRISGLAEAFLGVPKE